MSGKDPSVKGVGKRAQVGLKWTLIGEVGANATRLVVFPVLGRLLSIGEFGAVAAAVTVLALGQMMSDIGVGPALVQKKTLTPEQIEAAAGFSLTLGVAIGALVFLSAPLAARFYHSGDLTQLVRAVAVMFVIRGFGSVPRALCQRDMQFRALAAIDFVSYFAGSLTSVTLAWQGAGMWSLIVGYLVENTIATVAVYSLRPTRVFFVTSLAGVRDFLRFGVGTTLADIASYFANFGDNMVVGHSLGEKPLGLYTRAYDLMRFPSAVFTNVAGYVLFSAFARLQDDRDRLGRAFRRGTFLTAVVLMPASAGLIVVAPEMIRVLLGDKWGSAVLPFQILSVSMMARTSWKIGGTMARASGDVYAVAVANIAYGILILTGALIGSHWGIVGVAVAVSIECSLHYIVYSYLGLRRTSLPWTSAVWVHVEALIASGIALALIWPTAAWLRSVGAIDIVVVAGAVGAGIVSLVVSAAIGVARRQIDWLFVWEGAKKRLATLRRSGPARPAPR